MFFYEERILRIINEIQEYILSNTKKLNNYKFKSGPYSSSNINFSDSTGWSPFKENDRWGEWDKSFLFSCKVEIPEEFDGKTIALQVFTNKTIGRGALNPQFIIYVDGKLIQGLDPNHKEVILTEKATKGQVFDVLLHAYSGMKKESSSFSSSISILNKDIEELYYNIKVPYDIAVLLEKEDKRRIDIIEFLNKTINLLDLRKPFSSEFYQSIDEANNFIEEEFYGKYCGHEDIVATCVGHTHIDVAWFWTLAQTREKAAHSFSTVLNMMKEYPEYIFMSSQPQLYRYIKEDYPQLYEEIKKQIKLGRWEPEGAMWVEADCNVSSGESLIRQILFGKRFFKEEFNVDNKILWLPDVFGYSAALPQILKKSGVDYFMTTKISWNEYNKMPYDTFMWKGIDGTEILTHFITTQDKSLTLNPHVTTYNGKLVPSQVMGAWERYQQKDLNNEVLISFGYGDGGGGPTKEMLENSRRMAKGIPGCPRVKIDKSLEFFNRLEDRVSGKKKLPKWVGELYLEYHRGTYTSMARNKKFNRKGEFLYQDIELLSVLNKYAVRGAEYPQKEINYGWKIILLNQFHDILPGSSIKEVYEDSDKQYLEIGEKGKYLIDTAISGISSQIDLEEPSIIVFNQLGYDRDDLVEFKLPINCEAVEIYDNKGNLIPSQVVEGVVTTNQVAADQITGDKAIASQDEVGNIRLDTNISNISSTCDKKVSFFAENIPSKGYKAFRINLLLSSTETDSCSNTPDKTSVDLNKTHIIENKYFNMAFDRDYNIVSIYDKTSNREVIKQGERANVLQAFEDKPHRYDAWDINIYYQEKMWEINNLSDFKVVENGPVKTVVKIVRPFLDSTIEQYISLYNDIPKIDFFTRIDWKEKHILLKAAFPVDIHSDNATFEIQYGNVERPTHWNTSWDTARFETAVHKWMDLSEDNYGVSLLNDSKYGCDIKDGVMRLTLLKSADYPNIDADREIHEFTYSLYPHRGNWKEANTVQMAYNLNNPMYTMFQEANEGLLPDVFSFIKIDKENIFIEVVKKAEDSEDIIIRLYECYNRRTNATLTLFKNVSRAWECDLMENNLEEIEANGNCINFTILPYEIKTFKIRF